MPLGINIFLSGSQGAREKTEESSQKMGVLQGTSKDISHTKHLSYVPPRMLHVCVCVFPVFSCAGEEHGDCVAFDRPNVFGKAGCCWYPGGQAVVADGSVGKKCFMRSKSDGEQNLYFGEVWRQPAFFSTAHLSTQADEGAAVAVMDICLPLSHCSFRIFNCDGKPLYALEAKMLPSLSSPLELIWSYEIRNSSGRVHRKNIRASKRVSAD